MINIREEPGYSYDDLLLLPMYSNLKSRRDPKLSVNLMGGLHLDLPIFSSPMDTVTGGELAGWLAQQGGIGAIHRYLSIEDQAKQVREVKKAGVRVGASIGSNGNAWERAGRLIEAGADLLVVDVAHGDSASVLNAISKIKKRIYEYRLNVVIMSGNIATIDAASRSLNAGADLLRVGIGAGSACTTRIMAGIGVPQLTAIMDIREHIGDKACLVADGGIKNGGDATKAFAAGADAIMLGGFFARYPISPRPGEFRGMASRDALTEYKGTTKVSAEGESFKTDLTEDYQEHFDSFISGIKQGFAYLGADNMTALRKNANWIKVTPQGQRENKAHFA